MEWKRREELPDYLGMEGVGWVYIYIYILKRRKWKRGERGYVSVRKFQKMGLDDGWAGMAGFFLLLCGSLVKSHTYPLLSFSLSLSLPNFSFSLYFQ